MSAGRELIRDGKEGGVRGEWDGRTAKYVKIKRLDLTELEQPGIILEERGLLQRLKSFQRPEKVDKKLPTALHSRTISIILCSYGLHDL